MNLLHCLVSTPIYLLGGCFRAKDLKGHKSKKDVVVFSLVRRKRMVRRDGLKDRSDTAFQHRKIVFRLIGLAVEPALIALITKAGIFNRHRPVEVVKVNALRLALESPKI